MSCWVSDELWGVLALSPYAVDWQHVRQALVALNFEEIAAGDWGLAKHYGKLVSALWAEANISIISILMPDRMKKLVLAKLDRVVEQDN